MKVCIISDTHLSAQKYRKMNKKKNANQFMLRQFETMDWIASYLKDNGISTIIHGGDLFDTPRVSPYALKRAKDILSQFDCYIIKGNHDDTSFLHDEEVSAIDLMGVHAINTPTAITIGTTNFVFNPWRYEIDETLVKDNTKNVLVAHGFPKDLKTGSIPNETAGDLIGKKSQLFDLVITGHYHKAFEFESGSTRYLNPGAISAYANDVFDPSIWILDTETLQYERVEIPCAIKLIDVTPEDPEEFLDSVSEENIYRVRVAKMPSKEVISKARRKALDLQFRLIDIKANDCTEEKTLEFWEYVKDKKPEYFKPFKELLVEVD